MAMYTEDIGVEELLMDKGGMNITLAMCTKEAELVSSGIFILPVLTVFLL